MVMVHEKNTSSEISQSMKMAFFRGWDGAVRRVCVHVNMGVSPCRFLHRLSLGVQCGGHVDVMDGGADFNECVMWKMQCASARTGRDDCTWFLHFPLVMVMILSTGSLTSQVGFIRQFRSQSDLHIAHNICYFINCRFQQVGMNGVVDFLYFQFIFILSILHTQFADIC